MNPIRVLDPDFPETRTDRPAQHAVGLATPPLRRSVPQSFKHGIDGSANGGVLRHVPSPNLVIAVG